MFSWTRKETQFQQTCRKFRQKTWSIVPWKYESETKQSFEKIRLRIFLWTQRKLFRPPYWNFFLQKINSFSFIVSKW